MGVRHELENLREKTSIQMAFSKRQKTDLATLEFEVSSFSQVSETHLGDFLLRF